MRHCTSHLHLGSLDPRVHRRVRLMRKLRRDHRRRRDQSSWSRLRHDGALDSADPRPMLAMFMVGIVIDDAMWGSRTYSGCRGEKVSRSTGGEATAKIALRCLRRSCACRHILPSRYVEHLGRFLYHGSDCGVRSRSLLCVHADPMIARGSSGSKTWRPTSGSRTASTGTSTSSTPARWRGRCVGRPPSRRSPAWW